LPKTAVTKLAIVIPEKVKMDLDRYAGLHSERWGEPIDAVALIPHMSPTIESASAGLENQ